MFTCACMNKGTVGWHKHVVNPGYFTAVGEKAGRGLALSLYIFIMYCLTYCITCMYYC